MISFSVKLVDIMILDRIDVEINVNGRFKRLLNDFLKKKFELSPPLENFQKFFPVWCFYQEPDGTGPTEPDPDHCFFFCENFGGKKKLLDFLKS